MYVLESTSMRLLSFFEKKMNMTFINRTIKEKSKKVKALIDPIKIFIKGIEEANKKPIENEAKIE